MFPQLRTYDFCDASTKCCPVTTFGTVSCLGSPDIAIHQTSHCTTSQNAAPAKKLQNAQAHSAAPATRRRRAKIDTLLKYCACHATRKRHPKEQNHAICEEIQLQQMILSHFVNGTAITQYFEQRRTAANTDERQRTQEPRSANTLQPPDPTYKREPFATHSGKKTIYTTWIG